MNVKSPSTHQVMEVGGKDGRASPVHHPLCQLRRDRSARVNLCRTTGAHAKKQGCARSQFRCCISQQSHLWLRMHMHTQSTHRARREHTQSTHRARREHTQSTHRARREHTPSTHRARGEHTQSTHRACREHTPALAVRRQSKCFVPWLVKANWGQMSGAPYKTHVCQPDCAPNDQEAKSTAGCAPNERQKLNSTWQSTDSCTRVRTESVL